ncbi:MarR family winged helix-turn-helix transcriptional regulator [Clostridium perfringens]|uniref:MarR family winged helix-turn-helix transcriptional regulator n=1 Tax=Clostridium perfringens TaxID=1502 RepID=UPI0024BC0B22|nr:MarR family transcriptional regulator [Clostridium perfringens]
MKESELVLNNILVKLFNNILRIEEFALKSAPFNDLSITEMHTIEAIGIEKARTMSEVALDLKITVGTLTTAINKLIKKGYVNRRIEEDRRVVMIELTEKGTLAYKVHEKFHEEMIDHVLEELGVGEEEVLISSLDKLDKFFQKKLELMKSKES